MQSLHQKQKNKTYTSKKHENCKGERKKEVTNRHLFFRKCYTFVSLQKQQGKHANNLFGQAAIKRGKAVVITDWGFSELLGSLKMGHDQ